MTAPDLEIEWADDVEWPEEAKAALMRLRKYQTDCVAAVHAGWAEASRQLVVMSGGCGKTVVFANIARDEVAKGGKVLIIAHTDELLEQAIDKLRRSTGLEADKEKADDHASPFASVVIASVQTLTRDNRLTGFADDHFSLVIVDECLPSTAQIDGRSIAEIKVGDYVNSFNHSTGEIEQRSVLRLFKNPAKKLIKIYSHERVLCCTENHPIFSPSGYRSAGSFKAGDYIASQTVCVPEMRHGHPENRSFHRSEDADLQPVPQGRVCEAVEVCNGSMQAMRRDGEMHADKTVLHEFAGGERKTSLLLNHVSGFVAENELTQDYRRETGGVQLQERERPHEGEQPYVYAGREGESGSQTSRQDVSFSRRERNEYAATKSVSGCARQLTNRIPDPYSGSCEKIRVPSAVLQSGHSGPFGEAGDRGRWNKSRSEEVEVSGCEKDGGIEFVRVDRVEILEQGSGRGFNEVCPDGFVYNFEVEGNNNYFANGILVHNCHRSLSKSYLKIIYYFHFGAQSLAPDWVMPDVGAIYQHKARILGVTATASRGDKRDLGELYQKIAFEYGLLEAVRDGYLVKPIVKNIPLKIDMRGVKISRAGGQGSDFDLSEVTNRIAPILKEVAKQIAIHAPTLKTVIFTPSVETARLLSEALRDEGMNASFVSGACADRDEKIDAFRAAGPGSVLANALLVVEGFDVPDITGVCILRPTKIWSFFVQASVRGTRTLTGLIDNLETREDRLAAIAASAKPSFTILDFLWLSDRIDLIQPVDLVATKPAIRKAMLASGETDLVAAESVAERDLLKSLAAAAKKHARKAARTIDPIALSVSLGDASLANYEPETSWDMLKPTEGQISFLQKQGIDTSKIGCKGLASKVINRVISRLKHHLATPRQLSLMMQLGLDEQTCATLTINEASALLDRTMKAKRQGSSSSSLAPEPAVEPESANSLRT